MKGVNGGAAKACYCCIVRKVEVLVGTLPLRRLAVFSAA